MACNKVKRCREVEMDIMSSVRWLLFMQHSKVFGFVYLREGSYAGGCLLWTCVLRVSAHPENWVNTCQGLDSVHYAADNRRAYGATMFVFCYAAIKVGLCLSAYQNFLTCRTNSYVFWWNCKLKQEIQKLEHFPNFNKNTFPQSQRKSLHTDEDLM